MGCPARPLGTGSESGKTKKWWMPRPYRAPWVPGVPGTTREEVVLLAVRRSKWMGCPARPLGTGSESGKTKKWWMPRPSRAPWVPGFPGTTREEVVLLAVRRSKWMGCPARPLRTGSESGKTKKWWMPRPSRAPWVPGFPGATSAGAGSGRLLKSWSKDR